MQQFQPPTQHDWQPPQYPPPPETYYPPQTPIPPPHKGMRRNDKIALWAFVILVVGCVIGGSVIYASNSPSGTSASLSQANQQATATDVSFQSTAVAVSNAPFATFTPGGFPQVTPVAQPTDTPTSPTQTGIGSSQISGPWSITINSIKPTVSDNQFEVPKHGNQFVLVNFTALNTDSAPHDMNPYYFTLRDDSGTSYDLTALTVARSADGTIVGGQRLRGDLAYELPKTLHNVTLQFDLPGDFDHSQLVQWNLRV